MEGYFVHVVFLNLKLIAEINCNTVFLSNVKAEKDLDL